jgi:hypothetical protein
MLFKPYESKFFKKSDLDLMFIMDCTSSMSSWISAAKNELKSIIEFVKNEHSNTKVRISFIGYRDHCDGKNRITKISFTEDVDLIKNFIAQTPALGGGDLPEDVAGGF